MRTPLLLSLFFLSVTSSSSPVASTSRAPAPSLRELSSESMGEATDPAQRDVLAQLSKIKCIFSDLDGTLCHFDR
jgi:hypothetical protein